MDLLVCNVSDKCISGIMHSLPAMFRSSQVSKQEDS